MRYAFIFQSFVGRSTSFRMSCLDDDTVLRFVQRRLGQRDAERVDAHIATCDDCRILVAEAAKYMLDTRGGDESDPLRPSALQQGEVVDRYRIVAAIGR